MAYTSHLHKLHGISLLTVPEQASDAYQYTSQPSSEELQNAKISTILDTIGTLSSSGTNLLQYTQPDRIRTDKSIQRSQAF